MHNIQMIIIHRRKKAASESSMGETEDEHNEKFSNLKRDVADSGKKKSVGFTVGQGEVKHYLIFIISNQMMQQIFIIKK